MTKEIVEEFEREIGDETETIDYYSDKQHVVLPEHIFKAAMINDTQKVLNWLGPFPVDKQRVNARNPEKMETTLAYHCEK